MNSSLSNLHSAFSDDQSVSDVSDRFNSIAELIIKGKKAMKAGGGLLTFKRKLVKDINILNEKREMEPPTLNLDDEYQSMILDTWIEELIRFLALKTITGDYTEPCQLLPGHAIGVAWRVIMTNPSLYSKICLAMGNQYVFDHHPADTAAGRVQEKYKIKRYNATLRAYESYFDQQPQPLYWSFHPKEKEDDSITMFMTRLCVGDTSCLTDAFGKNAKTRDQGMSPNMPLLY